MTASVDQGDPEISTYIDPLHRYTLFVSRAMYIFPVSPVQGKPARFANSRTSSTKEGSWIEGTFPVASSPAYPLATHLFAVFSAVYPRAFCFAFHVVFSVSVTNRYEAD